MSVLFKALAKASKTREAAAAAAPPVGQPVILNRGGGGSGGRKRLLMLTAALVVGVAGGSYLFFLTGDSPTPVRPAVPKLHVPVIRAPGQPQAAAPAPAPSPAAMPVAPAPVQPTPEQPQIAGQTAAPPAQDAVLPPPAGVAAASANGNKKSDAPIMSVEEDLPTLLARLRRQKADNKPVAVSRAPARHDLVDEDGHAAIQVGVAPQADLDVAHTAYDDLIGGRYEQALGNYDKALKSEPRSTALQLGRATALQKLGRGEEARKAYSQVLAADPSNREALTNITMLLSAQSPEKALSDLQALRQANPGFSPIDAAIGARQAALGDVGAAIDSLNHAVTLSPENGLYRLNLAILQDRAGQADDAAASYRSALTLLGGATSELPLPTDQIRRRLAYLERR